MDSKLKRQTQQEINADDVKERFRERPGDSTSRRSYDTPDLDTILGPVPEATRKPEGDNYRWPQPPVRGQRTPPEKRTPGGKERPGTGRDRQEQESSWW